MILKEWLGEPPKTFSPATPDDEPKQDFTKKRTCIDLHHVSQVQSSTRNRNLTCFKVFGRKALPN